MASSARPSIESLKTLGQFATNLNWNIAIASWPNKMSTNILSQDDFNFRARNTQVPMYDSQPIQIAIRGHVVKQPGTYIPTGNIEFQLVETTDNKVSAMLKEWRELCWSSIYGVQNNKVDVQATLYLELLDSQDNIRAQYFLYGCFLERFDPLGTQLSDGMQQEILAPQITLSYDYFIDNFVDNTDPSAQDTNLAGSPPTFGTTNF